MAAIRRFFRNFALSSSHPSTKMSQYCIFLKVPAYLDQWLRHDFWNPQSGRVEFPRGSNAHAIMSRYLRRLPSGYERVYIPGLLPVEVPTFKGMNPDQHNYLIKEGQKALVSALKRNFKSVLDKELSVFYSQDVSITDIIYAFMAVHGIEPTEKNWETIRQMYKRLRDKSITPNNVN